MQLLALATVDIEEVNQMEELLLLLWLPDTIFIDHFQ